MLVKLDTRRIKDRASFHDVFAETFGFPAYYGRNMDAWIDCISYLNDPEGTDNSVSAGPGEIVVLQLDYVDDFAERCPELYDALIECAAFVNWRQIEAGSGPVLALSYFRTPPTPS